MHFLRFSFTKALEFRLEFTFRIVMDLAYHLSMIFLFKILFQHTKTIGNWTEEQMIVFAASYILVDALYMSVVATNCWWFPQYINKGDLDYYLTRPVSPLFFLSLREFAANSFINLIFAISIFAWALFQLPGPLEFFHTLFYIFLIINGVAIYYILQMMCYLPVFWTQSPRGFESLFWGINSMLKYPDKIQGGLFRFFFTFLIPMNLVVALPGRYYFDQDSFQIVALIFGLSIFFWWVYLKIWNKALRQYSSASS